MMGLFTVSKLLLMTLLLQLTKEDAEWKTHPTPDADSSVRFGEFCLRISEDSHRTSSQSVTQLPSKSAHPTKQATQLPQQPTTQPTSTVWDSAQTDIQEISMIPMMHPLNLQSHVNDGCRCQEKERTFPNSLIIKVVIRFPSESCNSTEIIVTAKDGSDVCLRIPSFLEYYIELSRRWSEPVPEARGDEELSVISPPIVDPTTELPITTQLSVTENNQFDDPNPPTIISSFLEHEEMEDKRVNGKSSIREVSAQCESCNFITNLDSVDPKDVQSLNVKMQSFPCPVHIHLILKNDSNFCLDSNQFNTLLKKLENPPPHEDHIHQTLTNNGCRCQEKEEKPPTENFIITRIWPPSETCNSTEFIETETNGNEVCVTAASFLAHLDFASLLLTKSMTESEPVYVLDVLDERSEVELVIRPCVGCARFLVNIDPKDVLSLEMDQPSFHCPILAYVILKNGMKFCVDLSDPVISTVLEKLKMQD